LVYIGCLTHGPLSFTLMVNQLDQQLEKEGLDNNMPRRYITSFKYRCLSPLVVNDPITVLGKQIDSNSYQLWILDNQEKLAVKGIAFVD
jgi:3-methylfumaryl-CoA hydratase